MRTSESFSVSATVVDTIFHERGGVCVERRVWSVCCSNAYQRVEQQGIKTWSFYRYGLTVEYEDKPPLAPPLIVINLLWRVLIYRFSCCHKECQICSCGLFGEVSTVIY